MNQGYGKVRYDLMYNDFVLIGPKKDNKTCSSIENKMIEIKNQKLNLYQEVMIVEHTKRKRALGIIKYKYTI